MVKFKDYNGTALEYIAEFIDSSGKIRESIKTDADASGAWCFLETFGSTGMSKSQFIEAIADTRPKPFNSVGVHPNAIAHVFADGYRWYFVVSNQPAVAVGRGLSSSKDTLKFIRKQVAAGEMAFTHYRLLPSNELRPLNKGKK